jgi:SAM-dependent methyltransferase
MHESAKFHCQNFFDTYISPLEIIRPLHIVEIGSLNINGKLDFVCKHQYEYIGIDFVNGNNVDIVLDDPYKLPLETDSVDIIIASSCFEHSEMFWLLFVEILRVLKPSGLFYLNSPSNGDVHRFPVDCWRFYPDSGKALIKWAQRNNFNSVLLESYTGFQINDIWNDFVAVFLKDEHQVDLYPHRIINTMKNFSNGIALGLDGILQPNKNMEDRLKLQVLIKKLNQS